MAINSNFSQVPRSNSLSLSILELQVDRQTVFHFPPVYSIERGYSN